MPDSNPASFLDVLCMILIVAGLPLGITIGILIYTICINTWGTCEQRERLAKELEGAGPPGWE